MEHGFSWVEALPIISWLPNNSATAAIVAAILIYLAVRARTAVEAAGADAIIPDGKLTARELFDMVLGWLGDMAEDVIGHGGRKHASLFGTLFLFILFSNLMGLVPGFLPPTDSINTTFGLAIISFGAYNLYGFREHGPSYLKQFVGPVLWLAPLMIIVEVFSHAFRPASLAIRLFGNMFADHLVLSIFTDLTKIVIPVIFYGLGMFVSVVQAFVFTVLTMVYIGLAVSHDH